MSLNKEKTSYAAYIKQAAKFCKLNGLNTQKSIYKWMVSDLMDRYKGKAPKWKIEWVAEDLTESICLELNIHQKGIRK